MAKTLPKIIYAKKEQDRDEEFIISSESPAGISESEEAITAGEYELKRKVQIINRTTVHPL